MNLKCGNIKFHAFLRQLVIVLMTLLSLHLSRLLIMLYGFIRETSQEVRADKQQADPSHWNARAQEAQARRRQSGICSPIAKQIRDLSSVVGQLVKMPRKRIRDKDDKRITTVETTRTATIITIDAKMVWIR